MTMGKLHAYRVSQLNIVDDPTEQYKEEATKALMANRRSLAHLQLKASSPSIEEDVFLKQPDLMYVEAVLVTEGINDNDDAFVHSELWNAQGTPILKPINVAHRDQNICGVMYGVEARKLDGTVITEDDGEPFELVMKGVIWHYLPHLRPVAKEIAEKYLRGEAYVSMECWFEGYDYGLYDQDGNLIDVIERCDDTAHLEKCLRACGGSGKYNGMRIGRALSGITFGGVGFVDVPANRRSDVLNLFLFHTEASESVATDLNEKPNNVVEESPMEGFMNNVNQKAVAHSGDSEVRASFVRQELEEVLTARDRAEAEKRAKAELDTVKAERTELQTKLQKSEATLNTVSDLIDEEYKVAKAAVSSFGKTPQEIARIDEVVNRGGSGDEVFRAKIAYIAQTRAALATASTEEIAKLKAENEELKAQVREAVRTEEITAVFAGLLTDEEMEAMVQRGLAKSDDDYAEWLEEKQLFAGKMKNFSDEEVQKVKVKKEEKSKSRLMMPADETEKLEDNGVKLQSGHGRVPSSVPNPRSLANTDELEGLFEEVEDGVNLAGASADEEAESLETAFEKTLASLLKKPDVGARARAFGIANNNGGN